MAATWIQVNDVLFNECFHISYSAILQAYYSKSSCVLLMGYGSINPYIVKASTGTLQ
jgi:hypothetical protein